MTYYQRFFSFSVLSIFLLISAPSILDASEFSQEQSSLPQSAAILTADAVSLEAAQEKNIQAQNDILALIQKNEPVNIKVAEEDNPSKKADSDPAGETNASTFKMKLMPNDPFYSSSGAWGQEYGDQWGIKTIGLDETIWDYYQGEGIKIAVVDTGVLLKHPDISKNIWTNPFEIAGNGKDDDGNGYVDDIHGWDFTDQDNNPTDESGHGTHVAGIAAAAINNRRGIAGVAPKAKIIAIRTLDENGSGKDKDTIAGIRYAVDIGADVINLSLGSSDMTAEDEQALRDVILYAKSKNVIVVAAAGNDAGHVLMPASLEGAIAVGASNPYNSDAIFSNFGSDLLIMAPGVDILSLGTASTHIGDRVRANYYKASGTSMATPFVSGAVALILNKYPDATFEDVVNLLAAGADDMEANVDGIENEGWDPVTGFGELNIGASLRLRPEDVESFADNSLYKKFNDADLEYKTPPLPEIPELPPFVPVIPARPYVPVPSMPAPYVPPPSNPYVWGGNPFVPAIPSFRLMSLNRTWLNLDSGEDEVELEISLRSSKHSRLWSNLSSELKIGVLGNQLL